MSVADRMAHEDYMAAINDAVRAGIKDLSRAEWDQWFKSWLATKGEPPARAKMLRRARQYEIDRRGGGVLTW